MAEANAKTRPTQVQTLGDKPVDANPCPNFLRGGFNESLKLFNTSFSPDMMYIKNDGKLLEIQSKHS